MKQELTYCEIKKQQDKKYNDEEIYLYNEYSGGSSIMPIKKNTDNLEWLKAFVKDQKKFNKEQRKFNEEMLSFKDNQLNFNKEVINRLDNIDNRLDNVESKVDAVALDLKETKLRNNLR